MTAIVDLTAVSDDRIETAVLRALENHCHRDEDVIRAEFAANTARSLLAMRPPAELGERAAGLADGLKIAARAILRLAGIPFTPDHLEEANRACT